MQAASARFIETVGEELYIRSRNPQGHFLRPRSLINPKQSPISTSLAIGLILVTTGLATPTSAEMPLPARKPPTVPLPDRKPPPPPPLPPHPKDIAVPDWSKTEVIAARAACERLLGDIEVAHEPVASLRQGRCGTPGPVKITALGKQPPVQIAPPATLTCGMAAAVGRWLAEVVQPAARAHLGEPVTGIRNAASYVCRRRYNDRSKRISEHALANALDISAFRLRSGAWITVLEHWPHAKQAVPDKAPETTAATAAPRKPTGPAEATHAGTATDQPPPGRSESVFLQAVYGRACGIFGTTLGPDANAAHRDHFHFDLKRRRTAYCR